METGKEAFKITVENVEYIVDGAGNLYNTTGEYLGVASTYLGDKWHAFLGTEAGNMVASAFDWTLDQTSGLVKTAGGAVVGFLAEGLRGTFVDKVYRDFQQFGADVKEYWNKYDESAAQTQKRRAELLRQFQQQGVQFDETGRIISKNPEPVLLPTRQTGESNTAEGTTTPLKQPERGDLITLYENGQIVKSLTKAEVDSVCAFAKQSFDAEGGYILKVVGENGEPSTLYYEPDGVVGSGYKRRGSTKPVNLKPATLILSERQYQAAIQEIYRRQKQLNMKDTAFENAIRQYPFMQQQVQQESFSQRQEIIPHTPHTGALRVNYLIPGTSNYSMLGLTAEQVQAVRNFVAGKPDTAHQGYQLQVTGNDYQTPVSELYYVPNQQGTAYVRRGSSSQVGIPISEATFKLNETQLQASIMGIMLADAERGYQDPALKAWYDLYVVQPKQNQPKAGQARGVLEGGTPQDVEKGITKGSTQGQGTVQGTSQGQTTGTGVLPNGMTQKEEDSRNFFLSIGNFIDNSVFGPLADMIPISLLSKALRMLGNCISGLFKTIGYVMEGEWSKAGTQLFGWVKDVAIVGGVVYGATILKDKLKDIFPSTSSNENSSSSSSSSSGLEDIIAGALGGVTNSGSSSGTANTTPAPTVKPDVYVELNHSSAGKVMGEITTITNANGTTERLLTTSDRFLPAAEIQKEGSDGTLWRVQLDTKSKNK